MGAKATTIEYAVPVTQKLEGSSAIYRNPNFKDKLTESIHESVKTLKDVYVQSFKKNQKRKCLGWIVREKEPKKQWIESFTYGQVYQKAVSLGSSIVGKKLAYQPEGEKMKFIGIFSTNRPEWTITDLACIFYGMTTIPIYDTLGDENITYVFKHTNLTTVFINKVGLKALLNTHDMGNVKTLISYDPFTQEDKKYFQKKGIELLNYSEMLQYGQKNRVDYNQKEFDSQPSDCVTFSYTSGTTGPPKGAMLSHRNFTALLASMQNNQQIKMYETDVSLCYLPLPHVLERDVVYLLMSVGGHVVYFGGDINQLKDDLALVRPTIFVSVPRLYSRFYQVLNKKFDEIGGYAKAALNHGINIKLKNAKVNGGYSHKVYDTAFFNKTKAALGGRVRYMVSGSAPLLPDVHSFMKIAMCCPFLQAYGQTQSIGGSFITHTYDTQIGHVGGPVSALEYKLVDLPEMNYTSLDKNEKGQPMPRGQIWMRGPPVFLGYYKNQQKTEEALTEDGWLKSGDVGAILPHNKALKIIDRKKNIFKLQQGQYVASEKVENVYMKFGQIAEMFLHGESTQTFAILIAVPKKEYIEQIAKENQIEGTFQQLCQNTAIKKIFLEQINKVGQQNGLKSFQQAKNVFLQSKPFLQKGILTNTMKLQRHQAKIAYAPEIKQLYSQGMLPIGKSKK